MGYGQSGSLGPQVRGQALAVLRRSDDVSLEVTVVLT